MTNDTLPSRAYDIVVFGATGFTGRLTARYLAQSADAPRLRWALAGRNHAKLETVHADLKLVDGGSAPDLIVCDINNPADCARLAEQCRVLITTVGPYLNYGEPLVKACVDAGTHYVDLTGEPEFVESMHYAHDDAARQKQIKIVNCCGFDSIPHDLGALYTVNTLNALLGKDAGKHPVTLRGFVTANGTISGGTWHSAVTQMSRLREFRQKRKVWKQERATRPSRRAQIKLLPPRIFRVKAFDAYACPLPTIDPQVVCRTAYANPAYGPEFHYGHYALTRSPLKIAGSLIAVGGILALSQLAKTRDLLLRFRQPGDGPTEHQREHSWFKVKFIASARGMHVWTQVSGGDPGYAETSKMLAESALCLAFDTERLPSNYGVITPALAMGEPLIERLQAAGITFETL